VIIIYALQHQAAAEADATLEAFCGCGRVDHREHVATDQGSPLMNTPSTHAGESCGPGAEFSMAALAARPNLRVLKVVDIHARETIDDVRAFQPHVGLSLAAPILRRELFAIPAVGTVNLHKGKVPDYRGMPPAFWELWNDEESVGCTVHWVDDRLDTGEVAAETVVEREKYSTFRGLQLRLDEIGVELMRHVIGEIFKGMRPATPQRPGGRTYRKPTLADLARRVSGTSGHSGSALPCRQNVWNVHETGDQTADSACHPSLAHGWSGERLGQS
jgi:hypothetical protein